MTIKNQDALNKRASNLGAFNGIKLVLVTLRSGPDPKQATLEVHFYNSNQLSSILKDVDGGSKQAKDVFPITGGHRILGGPLAGQVRVVSIAKHPDPKKDSILRLTVEPIGDYSTYTLSVVYQNIDPLFNEIGFKFRPGCFNNCPPDWEAPPAPKPDPAIDYLAKDYDSFRHTLIAWMINRVPGWQPTSEADLDQVLLELFSVAADELSDYQDRVMNEAYLATARERVSLARHARLMDYHIHQGNQASTWLALKVSTAHKLGEGFQVGTGEDVKDPSSTVFITRPEQKGDPPQREQDVDPLLNDISLYTWGDSIPALAAGSTSADLSFSTEKNAEKVQDLIRTGKITHLLIQEHLNPLTGEARGRDPTKRQLLKLLPGNEGAEAKQDPVPSPPPPPPPPPPWFVRVRWEEKDKLKSNYCFTVDCPGGKRSNVSLFHANLVPIYHGRPRSFVFKDPEMPVDETQNERHYERTNEGEAICRLPNEPLAYTDTPPDGITPPKSTLEVEVEVDSQREPWDEVISLVHSDDSDERGDHFVVETDEEGRSLIRFGDGTNGKKLPEKAIVRCAYQVGRGQDGNVGADALIAFDKGTSNVLSVWNPFDVTNGRDPEPAAEIIRRVPEAYRYRQLRAVTLKDYVDRTEEVPGVSRASARYMWTGSWRTVRVTVDPVGTTTLTQELREDVARHLDAVRLLGEDLEIRPPQFVPLDILVSLCVAPDYWPEDVRFVLEQEFSDGYTPDGRIAFFHPDRWTFGQELRASQIVGVVQSVEGVDHVLSVSMKRWNEATPGTPGLIEVRPNEILQVRNDPDHMEKGLITFDLKGGRQ